MNRKEKFARYFQENKTQFNHYNAEGRDRLKAEMVTAYGGSCVICDESDPVALCLDHIDDDAYVEKEEFGLNARGGHKQYARLKIEGWPRDRFQLLCYNCNAKKEYARRREQMLERNGPKKIHDPHTWHAKEGPKSNSTSGIKGVSWNSQKNRWQAKIMVNRQSISLGFFKDDPEGMFAAGKAYEKAAAEQWGLEANIPSDSDLAEVIEEYFRRKQLNQSIDMSSLLDEE